MFGKAHGYLCSTPSLRSFFSIAFEFNTFSMLVWLMVALLQPSKAYHWELPPFYAPLRWFTVWCPRLDVPAASVASSSTLGTNSGCFAQQSICSPCTGMSRTVYLCTGVFKDGCWTLSMTHIINASVGSFHPTFCSELIGYEDGSMFSLTGSPTESMSDCFHLHCQVEVALPSDEDDGHILADTGAPPLWVFGDWAFSVHYEILWFSDFFDFFYIYF